MHLFPAGKLVKTSLKLQCTMNIPRRWTSLQIDKVRSNTAFHTSHSSCTDSLIFAKKKIDTPSASASEHKHTKPNALSTLLRYDCLLMFGKCVEAPDRQQALATKRNALWTFLYVRLFVKTWQMCERRFRTLQGKRKRCSRRTSRICAVHMAGKALKYIPNK